MSGTGPRPKSAEAEAALIDALRELGLRVEGLRAEVTDLNINEKDELLGPLAGKIVLALDGVAKLAAVHAEQPRRWLIEGLERPIRAMESLSAPTGPDSEMGYYERELRKVAERLGWALSTALRAAALVYPDVQGVPNRPGYDETAISKARVRSVLGQIEELEKVVDRIGKEATTKPDFPQQGELVTGYVNDMEVAIDEKRLIVTVGEMVVDLGALVSVLETMLDLTDDFRASVNAWVGEITEALFEASGDLAAPLRRLVAAARAMGALIAPEAGREFVATDPQMVLIRPRRFLMGISKEETKDHGFDWDDHSRPQRRMKIDRLFLLGRFPVTRGEYAEFAADTGRMVEAPDYEQNDRHPAVNVSFEDALAYCDWLSDRTGLAYRLPSEAEWEYACRAGTETARWWGDAFDPTKAHVGTKGTTEVDAFPANPWGLRDMLGNVFEWCADPWHDTHRGRPTDGSVWVRNGTENIRVVRGGSFNNVDRYARAGNRYWNGRAARPWVGFRLARTL